MPCVVKEKQFFFSICTYIYSGGFYLIEAAPLNVAVCLTAQARRNILSDM